MSTIGIRYSEHFVTHRPSQLVTLTFRMSKEEGDNPTIQSATIHAVAVKLSPFSTQEPVSWFRRAEIQFRLRKITVPSTQADYVLEAIPENVFLQVSSWLDETGENVTYEDLKRYLLQEFTLTIGTRAQRLLSFPQQQLGDRSARHVWNEMQSLARLPETDATTGEHLRVDLMRELWLQTLSPAIRAALPEAHDISMADLVRKADKLMDASRSSRKPNAVAAIETEADVNIVKVPHHFDRQHSNYEQTKKPQPILRGYLLPSGICSYHHRFGKAARNCLQGCLWSKKRVARPPKSIPVAAQTSELVPIQSANSHERGLYLTDALSGRKFLIDTGAHCSIYPATPDDRSRPNTTCGKIKLVAANGSNIKMYGYRTITIQLSVRRFAWEFVIADVQTPLLGIDFLGHHGLLVDVANQRLLSMDTYQTSPLEDRPTYHSIHNCSAIEPGGHYDYLLRRFPEVFKPELRQSPGHIAKHGIFHHIQTFGPPVHARFRRLAPEKLAAAKHAFAEMERIGLCRKASSPWASPLHMVKKPDGSWRPCGDYRRLNLITEPDRYPVPNIADLTSNLHGAKVFSKLDLLKGYFQVPVHPDDVQKTAIVTPFGSYVFSYSTFGLRNAGATFQRMMDGLLGDLPYCTCYVDDILIFSKTEAEHHEHLRSVLQILRDNGLIARYDKCLFGSSHVTFLGHDISATGALPLPTKVEAVKSFPTPTTVKGLQEFVGMVNYYHRFLPNIAHKVAPLYAALTNKRRLLVWGQQQQQAFAAVKEALASATNLSFQCPGAPLTLTTDASNIAVGAVVEQTVNDIPQPLGFFSRKLRQPELKYSTFDRELLAVYLAVRHFRHLLEGTPFTIRTDHKPLVHAFSKASDAWSLRQQRHLSAIAEFGCDMEYVPGRMNPVADALSRVQIDSVHLGVDYNGLADSQGADPETIACRTAITNLKLEDVPFGDNGRTLLCDTSTGRPRPYVPAQWRRKIFDIIHGLSHPSGRSTASILTKKFVWHGINRDARSWARSCIACQSSKINRHTEAGIGKFPQPKRRFGHLHVDVVGPLPPSCGTQYLFTSTERSTRWPEAIPMTNATAQCCAEALLNGWISRFGVPDDITSDRGPAFISQLWTALGKLLGTTIHRTTAYNPAANGMVERTHRTLKAALMSRCTGPDWMAQLPWVLLGMRTTPKEGLNVSPAEMVFGDTISVPGEFFFHAADTAENLAELRRIVGKYRPCIQTHANSTKEHVPKTLRTCKFVFVRNDAHRTPLTRPYRGPYAVTERGEKAYKLLIGGRSDWVSIDRLKPAYTDSDVPGPLTVSRAGRSIRPPDRLQP